MRNVCQCTRLYTYACVHVYTQLLYTHVHSKSAHISTQLLNTCRYTFRHECRLPAHTHIDVHVCCTCLLHIPWIPVSMRMNGARAHTRRPWLAAGICKDMCTDTCIDMHADMCTGTPAVLAAATAAAGSSSLGNAYLRAHHWPRARAAPEAYCRQNGVMGCRK